MLFPSTCLISLLVIGPVLALSYAIRERADGSTSLEQMIWQLQSWSEEDFFSAPAQCDYDAFSTIRLIHQYKDELMPRPADRLAAQMGFYDELPKTLSLIADNNTKRTKGSTFYLLVATQGYWLLRVSPGYERWIAQRGANQASRDGKNFKYMIGTLALGQRNPKPTSPKIKTEQIHPTLKEFMDKLKRKDGKIKEFAVITQLKDGNGSPDVSEFVVGEIWDTILPESENVELRRIYIPQPSEDLLPESNWFGINTFKGEHVGQSQAWRFITAYYGSQQVVAGKYLPAPTDDTETILLAQDAMDTTDDTCVNQPLLGLEEKQPTKPAKPEKLKKPKKPKLKNPYQNTIDALFSAKYSKSLKDQDITTDQMLFNLKDKRPSVLKWRSPSAGHDTIGVVVAEKGAWIFKISQGYPQKIGLSNSGVPVSAKQFSEVQKRLFTEDGDGSLPAFQKQDVGKFKKAFIISISRKDKLTYLRFITKLATSLKGITGLPNVQWLASTDRLHTFVLNRKSISHGGQAQRITAYYTNMQVFDAQVTATGMELLPSDPFTIDSLPDDKETALLPVDRIYKAAGPHGQLPYNPSFPSAKFIWHSDPYSGAAESFRLNNAVDAERHGMIIVVVATRGYWILLVPRAWERAHYHGRQEWKSKAPGHLRESAKFRDLFVSQIITARDELDHHTPTTWESVANALSCAELRRIIVVSAEFPNGKPLSPSKLGLLRGILSEMMDTNDASRRLFEDIDIHRIPWIGFKSDSVTQPTNAQAQDYYFALQHGYMEDLPRADMGPGEFVECYYGANRVYKGGFPSAGVPYSEDIEPTGYIDITANST